jgi:alpha-beta hydrolase superfamily lysophospholipase
MAARGMATYALDLRGHGQSAGPRGHVQGWGDWTDDAAAFIDLVGREAGHEVVPLGHSFGGVVLLSAILDQKLTPARFILSSPALKLRVSVPAWKLRLGRVTSRLLPRLALDNEVDPRTLSRDPSVGPAYSGDPLVHSKITSRTYTEWLRASSRVLTDAARITSPFFATHGSDDRLIDPAGTEELYRRATVPGRKLKIYPDRYHEPFNDLGNDEVFADIADWLVKGA